jgi:HEAT repeat protein
VLAQLESAQLAEIRGRALEARARRGDAAARKALDARRAARPETPDTWEATLALARLGDAAAANEVARAVKDAVGSRKAAALGALRGVPTTPAVIDAIADALATGDDVVRDAAAEAAIDREAPVLVAPLKTVLSTARFTAPLRAAVALARMNDPSGQALIDANLGGDLPDGRIVAARAYVGRPAAGWAAKLVPVLGDPNPLMRVLAAELLLPVKQREALEALGPELEEENPVLRAEATRVLAASPEAPLALLRASLGDRAPWVRFHAADALARRGADAARSPAATTPRRRR